MKHDRRFDVLALLPVASFLMATMGCAYFPEKRQRDVIHNPFPQLKRVAILPFFNQSNEPTVNSDQVAEAYYAALQAVPGFEVLPVGVAKAQWLRYALENGEPTTGQDFQRLARQMGVEAIVVGSVTDFDPYYPPRMAMTVHWYAANEGFHAVPPGYGLPWGTEAEKQIPRRIAREAEFELARSQLATQTPLEPAPVPPQDYDTPAQENLLPPQAALQPLRQVANHEPLTPPEPGEAPDPNAMADTYSSGDTYASGGSPVASEPGPAAWGAGEMAFQADAEYFAELDPPMPADWPDPTDLIPDPPSPVRPTATANHEPVMAHTRLYRGDDPYFTNRLADYVETGDDARPGGWQDYLKRSDDFIRFCCHLHVTEMLESRGGSDQSDLILRWHLSRY